MKYKVTAKHPFLANELIIELEGSMGCYMVYVGGDHKFNTTNKEVEYWIENGQIEEIQPLEFTRDNMIKFGQCINDSCKNYNRFSDITDYDLAVFLK